MTQPPPYPGTPETPDEPGGGQTPPPPTQPPVYGAPSPYGAPQQPPAYGSPYGAPQPPPPYGAQNPYGAPAYPGGPVPPGSEQPSKGMAITALVLSFLGCTFIAGIVAIVLAIIVLVRGKDGRNHGKGLAISAIAVSVVVMIVTVGAIIGLGAIVEEQSVGNLETGECINADNLTDDEADSIGLIDKVSCSDDHDGEVVGTSELTAAQASSPSGIDCASLVDPDLLATLDPETLDVFWLTQDDSPAAGESFACVATNRDGTRLTEKLG